MSSRGSSAVPFREYRIQLSDGSTHAGGSLVWKTVGQIADIVGRGSTSQRYNNFEFPLTIARYFSFKLQGLPHRWIRRFHGLVRLVRGPVLRRRVHARIADHLRVRR